MSVKTPKAPKTRQSVIPIPALTVLLFSTTAAAPGCTDFWKPLAQINRANCVVSPDACQANEVCNMLTEQCEPRRMAAGDMAAGANPDLATAPDLATPPPPTNTYAALFQSGLSDQPIGASGWNAHATVAAVDVGSALNPTGWLASLSSGAATSAANSAADIGYTSAVTDRGFLSIADAQHVAPQVLFLWTSNTASSPNLATPQSAWLTAASVPALSALTLTKQNLVSVSFRVSNGNPDNSVFAALRIAGTWYLSATSAAKVGGAGFNDADAKATISVSAPIWEAMPGIHPELGQLSASAPRSPSVLPEGKIDAWGVISFTDGRKDDNSRIAIDNFVLSVAK